MTGRLVRMSRTARTPRIELLCPACRVVRRVRPVGTAMVGKRRREVVQCAEPTCELVWIPGRPHLTAAPAAA